MNSVVARLVVVFTLMTGSVSAETIALKAERLIQVETGKTVDQPLIIITDGRITAIGSALTMKPPAEARFIDLPGVTLVPGLIDMHVHLDSSPTLRNISFGDRFWAVLAVANAQKTLRAGFTTVRNVGADAYNDVGLREAIDEGVIEGPRIVTAAYSFGVTGGHCDSTYFPPSFDSKNPFNADSPDEGRKAVRTLKKYGAQVIKICATGGVFSRGTKPGMQQMLYEEIKAIVEVAHLEGMKVAVHAHGASGVRDSILAGADTIEHASLVDDEGIRLAVKHGTWFSMDIYNTEYTLSEGKKNGVPEESLQKEREVGGVQRENFTKAVKAGVKMVLGTDAGIYPHGDNAKQLAVMVRFGMTPLQALQAATTNAAQALGREADVGSIKVGAYGDLVGVSANPLTDISTLEAPVFVMKGGVVVVSKLPTP